MNCFSHTDFYYVFPNLFSIPTQTFCLEGKKGEDDFETRISNAIEDVLKRRKAFRGVDKENIIEKIRETAESVPQANIMNLPEDKLFPIVEKIIALELLSSITDDFSDEDMKVFRDSLKRREFFS